MRKKPGGDTQGRKIMRYTKKEARSAYYTLRDWSDADFYTAENNWYEKVKYKWGEDPQNACHATREDYEQAVEPYGEEFLDWCCRG
jgi:hypothetical protein